MSSATRQKEADKAAALARFREGGDLELHPGETVYTTLKHVALSGILRVLDVYVMRDNEPRRITYSVADAIGQRYNRNHDGVEIRGCGMDMGFAVVYALSREIWPDGFDCTDPAAPLAYSPACPSNDHMNRDVNAHHRDGGYALHHRWLG